MRSIKLGDIRMKDFFKLDNIIQTLSQKLKCKNKLSKLIKSVSFAWFMFTVIATIWSLIPKEEKLPEVDGNELLAAREQEKTAETEVESEAEAQAQPAVALTEA